MANLVERLRGFVLTASELKDQTDWSDQLVEDYLSLIDNIFEITDEVDNGTANTINLEQLIASNQAFISKLHSRINTFSDDIRGNAGQIAINKANIAKNVLDILNNLQLIASVDALLQKTRSSQNNLNKVFDDQIGLRETAATGVVSGGAVTQNTPTTIDIDFGDGEIVDGYIYRSQRACSNQHNMAYCYWHDG